MNTAKFEYCWLCGGRGKRLAVTDELHPNGEEPCYACKGTGYGESYATMRARREREELNAKTERKAVCA